MKLEHFEKTEPVNGAQSIQYLTQTTQILTSLRILKYVLVFPMAFPLHQVFLRRRYHCLLKALKNNEWLTFLSQLFY